MTAANVELARIARDSGGWLVRIVRVDPWDMRLRPIAERANELWVPVVVQPAFTSCQSPCRSRPVRGMSTRGALAARTPIGATTDGRRRNLPAPEDR